eukprot:1158759-Pelagomonas_calceolata.AAC.8
MHRLKKVISESVTSSLISRALVHGPGKPESYAQQVATHTLIHTQPKSGKAWIPRHSRAALRRTSCARLAGCKETRFDVQQKMLGPKLLSSWGDGTPNIHHSVQYNNINHATRQKVTNKITSWPAI